ncbi:hypothetical protein ACXGQW_03790 [Wenyingzhuangia sp. IMCC45533]
MRKIKISLIVLTVILLTFYVLEQGVNYMLSQKINEFKEQNKTVELYYKSIHYQLLFNQLTAEGISFKSYEKGINFSSNKVEIVGFRLLKFLTNDAISFSDVLIDKSVFEIKPPVKPKDDKTSTPPKISLDIDCLNLNNTEVVFINTTNDTKHKALVTGTLTHFELNDKTLQQSIPFGYEKFDFEVTDLYSDLSHLEYLKLEKLKYENTQLTLSNLLIKSKGSPEEHASKLVEEKEYLDLFFDEIQMADFTFKNYQETVLLQSKNIVFDGLNLNFFRDKRVKDNTVYKPLYSESINKLKAIVDFPEIKIKNGKVVYSMLMDDESQKGDLLFDDIDGVISVSNIKDHEVLTLEANGVFMKESALHLDVEFTDVSKNKFVSNGSLKNFKTESINSFLYKVLNIELEGEIDALYFDIEGNNIASRGDVKMRYDDLKLKTDRYNFLAKALSAVGNLVIKNSSEHKKDHFREAKIKQDRVQTKSLFNFLWISIRDGILKVLA